MNVEIDWATIAGTLVTSGILAVIVSGIIGIGGRILADRADEKHRDGHAKELEKLKADYGKQLEESKSALLLTQSRAERYNVEQFQNYSIIWSSLYDLKLAADALWESATQEDLLRFKKQYTDTSIAIHRMSLFLEEEHFIELRDLLRTFGEFEVGKRRLVEYRSAQALKTAFSNFGYGRDEVRVQIDRNRTTKEMYDELIWDIRTRFVELLRSPEQQFQQTEQAVKTGN